MKVLWANYCDYSNLTFGLSKAMQSVGIDSLSVAMLQHPFGYADQALHVSAGEMAKYMEAADCIVVGHSSELILSLVPPGKRVYVIHTGTAYRRDPERYNKQFNPIVERTFTDSPEFWDKGGKNITYVAAAINTDEIRFSDFREKKIVFAHYPSRSEFKGTAKIKEMMSRFPVEFLCETGTVSHERYLARINECDVYIELFAPTQEGNEYGSFGVTAFEAAAMGKIVVTNSLHHKIYTDTYGDCAMIIVNSEDEFNAAINQLMLCDQTELVIGKAEARQWIQEKHSLKATGAYLKQFFV